MGAIPIVLFVCSFILLILILLPSLGQRLREAPILNLEPNSLTITGTVVEELKESSGTTTEKPISGVIVESGGFRTVSGSGGGYELEFRSEVKRDVPVILRQGNHEIVVRVDFPDGEDQVRKNLRYR